MPTTTANLLIAYIQQSQASKEVTANAAFDVLDACIGGLLSQAITAADVTLTATQGQNAIYKTTGVLTGNRNLIIPSAVGSKLLVVHNTCTGAFTMTVKGATGTGVAVPQGKRALLYFDGTNVVDVGSTFSSIATTIYDLTYAATINVNWANGSTQRVTLTGNATFAFSGAYDGQPCVLEIIQDGTGSRLATWGAEVLFGTDVTSAVLTTTASKRDFVAFKYDNVTGKYYCVSIVKGY